MLLQRGPMTRTSAAGSLQRQQQMFLNTEQRSRQRATNQRIQEMKREKQYIECEGLQDKPKINKKSHELARHKIPLDNDQKL